MKYLQMLVVVALLIPLANVFSAPLSTDEYDEQRNAIYEHADKDTSKYCDMAKSGIR